VLGPTRDAAAKRTANKGSTLLQSSKARAIVRPLIQLMILEGLAAAVMRCGDHRKNLGQFQSQNRTPPFGLKTWRAPDGIPPGALSFTSASL